MNFLTFFCGAPTDINTENRKHQSISDYSKTAIVIRLLVIKVRFQIINNRLIL